MGCYGLHAPVAFRAFKIYVKKMYLSFNFAKDFFIHPAPSRYMAMVPAPPK
jgi:hypothetical protein